jgi:hypothetical protein
MKPPRPKARPTIFVGLDENRIPPVLVITGITWTRRRELGRDGLGCIWKPEKKSWERVFSLKVVEAMASWPEAALSPELQRYLEGARERARKQEEYYRRRARAAAKGKLVPETPL